VQNFFRGVDVDHNRALAVSRINSAIETCYQTDRFSPVFYGVGILVALIVIVTAIAVAIKVMIRKRSRGQAVPTSEE